MITIYMYMSNIYMYIVLVSFPTHFIATKCFSKILGLESGYMECHNTNTVSLAHTYHVNPISSEGCLLKHLLGECHQ